MNQNSLLSFLLWDLPVLRVFVSALDRRQEEVPCALYSACKAKLSRYRPERAHGDPVG
jgi:hypothetical protein